MTVGRRGKNKTKIHKKKKTKPKREIEYLYCQRGGNGVNIVGPLEPFLSNRTLTCDSLARGDELLKL